MLNIKKWFKSNNQRQKEQDALVSTETQIGKTHKSGLVLRLTEDKDAISYVHDNQIDSALEIIENFKLGNRWVLLMAQMQSGKSGTFFSVPYIITRNKSIQRDLNLITDDNDEVNIFMLTPMSDTELVEQFEQDIVNFTGINLKRNVIHGREMKRLMDLSDSKTESDYAMLQKLKYNSIIMIDESHYGSDKDQILNKFLKNVLEIQANDNQDALKMKNIYIVSISATPMAERGSMGISGYKKIVELINTPAYYGIIDMYEGGKIRQAQNLNTIDGINQMILDINNIPKIGYIIVRANDRGVLNIDDIITRLPPSIDYKEYNMETKKSIFNNTRINDILSDKPEKKTIFFIKGKLRAGQRVNTKNIIMVHDSHSSNSDTTAQSFLGRCCGYNKNKDIQIYVDLEAAEGYYKWVKSGFDPNIIPKAKNVSTGRKVKNEYKIRSVTGCISTIVDDSKLNTILRNDDGSKRNAKERMSILIMCNDYLITKKDTTLNELIINQEKIKVPTIYTVDSESKESVRKKHYIDKKNGNFVSDEITKDFKEEELGTLITSITYEKDLSELVIVVGEVVRSIHSKPIVNVNSMYHEV
jgi:hypothetical protein